jgi:hypothetical protein
MPVPIYLSTIWPSTFPKPGALSSQLDVRQWLAGDAVFDGTIYVPDTLKSGKYRLRVGILDPVTRQPAIQLAIEGKQSDGWYGLGEIQIE